MSTNNPFASPASPPPPSALSASSIYARLSVMMFFQFAVWGSWVVPFWTFLTNELKFSGVEAGWVFNTNQIAAILSPFVIGLFADKLFSTERVLAVLHLLGAALLFAAAQTSVGDARMMFACMLGYSLLYMPTLALVNTVSFRNLTDPNKQFPLVRVWGTIGWIVAGLVVGFFIGPKVECLYLAAGLSVVLGFLCLALPHTPPVKAEAGEKTSMFQALEMLREPSFAIFMVVSFTISIALAFYYQLANGFLTALNAPAPTALQTVGQVSEIVFMLLLPIIVSKLGVRWTLTLGMLAWFIRYTLFWTQSLWPIILIALPLHGICYDFFFVVSQLYVDNKAKAHLRASAQGLLTFVTLGCGLFLGNLLAGLAVDASLTPPKEISIVKAFLPTFLWEAKSAEAADTVTRVIQWPSVWAPAAVGCLIAIVFFLIGFREPKKEGEPTGK